MLNDTDQNARVTPNRSAVTIKAVLLTGAQSRATYSWSNEYQNGKPAFHIPCTSVINFKSMFSHKLLCSGLTFTAGMACAFGCTFCYVYSLLCRNPSVRRILAETRLNFEDIVIVKDDPMPVLRRELLDRYGRPRPVCQEGHEIYASPLVDVAANNPTAEKTIEICRFIFGNTNWTIRLLSKSILLYRVAQELQDHKDRLILGFSTGTLDDKMAASFERNTSAVSGRIAMLHKLQDQGFRTYAMLCPILPSVDPVAYAADILKNIRIDRCEHVWAEVLNARGASLKRTVDALLAGGFASEADAVMRVSEDRNAWEDYARKTFVALSHPVPPEKLRFLQYVGSGQTSWWRAQKGKGAILLGKHA